MSTDIDKERAAFEAWAKTHFGCSEYSFARAYEQGYYNTVHSNTYGGRKQAEYAPVSMLWDAWQAARATPPAPTPSAPEGQAEAEEWMRKAIAETRAAASLLNAGEFRGGMETACDEIETRMALDGAPLPRQAAVRGADTERLDWLEQRGNDGGLLLHAGNQDTGGHSGLGLINTGRTLRQAVDSARGVKAVKSAPTPTVKASQ